MIERRHFLDSNGLGLLRIFGNSPARTVQEIYPAHAWLPWKFHIIQRNWWKAIQNQRVYCDWLFEHLGFTKIDDWYFASRGDFERNDGMRLLNLYDNNISHIMKAVYHSHTWDDMKFFRKRRNLASIATQRTAFDSYATENNLNTMEAWYSVDTAAAFKNVAVRSILSNYYDSSVPNAVMTVYSDHKWLPWKFKRVPTRWWAERANKRLFMNYAMQQLKLDRMEGWYNVTVQDIQNLGGPSTR